MASEQTRSGMLNGLSSEENLKPWEVGSWHVLISSFFSIRDQIDTLKIRHVEKPNGHNFYIYNKKKSFIKEIVLRISYIELKKL